MRLTRLFRSSAQSVAAWRLYKAVVDQARKPGPYLRAGVPDTLDGRFELIALHAFVVLRRLKAEHGRTKALAQALFDRMFDDMDRSLREMGAGDLGVGRRVKAMASAFYGRIGAYESGLAGGDAALQAVLARNLYGTVTPDPACIRAMACYLRGQIDHIDSLPLARLMDGDIDFAPPVGEAGGADRQGGKARAD